MKQYIKLFESFKADLTKETTKPESVNEAEEKDLSDAEVKKEGLLTFLFVRAMDSIKSFVTLVTDKRALASVKDSQIPLKLIEVLINAIKPEDKAKFVMGQGGFHGSPQTTSAVRFGKSLVSASKKNLATPNILDWSARVVEDGKAKDVKLSEYLGVKTGKDIEEAISGNWESVQKRYSKEVAKYEKQVNDKHENIADKAAGLANDVNLKGLAKFFKSFSK